MLITKIQLIDITSHVNTVIQFTEGLNVLMGSNGTGKSSVLTMIGYVLFDHLPAKTTKKTFVRHGAKGKNGTICVWILADDGIEYSIERTLGKQSEKIRVKRVESESVSDIMGINSSQELREWLRKKLGIDDTFPLATIFENAIGVKQGTFISPFLMTAVVRSKIFAPLLNVEIYAKIYAKYVKISNKFRDQKISLENNESLLRGRMEQKPDLESKSAILEEKILTLNTSLKESRTTLKSVQKKCALLQEKKTHLEQTVQQREKFTLTLENLEKQKLNNTNLVSEAIEAKKICKKTRSDYEKYNQLELHEKGLKEEERKHHKLERELSEIAQEETSNSTNLDNILSEIQKIKTMEKAIPVLTEKKKKQDELERLHTKLKEDLTSIKEREDQLKNHSKESEAFEKRIKPMQIKVKAIPQLQKETTQINALQALSNKLEVSLSTLTVHNEELHKNLTRAEGGICPLCEQQYTNQEGTSLEDHFKEIILANEKQITFTEKKMARLTEKLQNLTKNQIKLEELNLMAVTLKGLLIQYSDSQAKIKILTQQVKQKDVLTKQLEQNIKDQEKLSPDVKRFIFISQSVGELSKKEAAAKRLKDILTDIRKNKKTPIEVQLKALKSISGDLIKCQADMDQCRENYKLYQVNIQSMKKLPELEKESEKIQLQFEKIQANLRKVEKTMQQLKKEFDPAQFDQIEEQRDTLKTKTAVLEADTKSAEEQLQEIKKTLKDLKKYEKELLDSAVKLNKLQQVTEFSDNIRAWFKIAKPKITETLMGEINTIATNYYRKIKGEEAVTIEWQEDYDVHLTTSRDPVRMFAQLSGGEQMAVALAIRLAILKTLTQVSFAFFDEPTTNLDIEKRRNLAECIQNVRGFKQIFVISHDDTFEERSDNVIKFSKNDEEETLVDFLP